ncbi:hypothetical protein K438DRAFT_1930818 [Mycena galopus ATCC 62051]|nr:hypothetical protein K438DRAFT_1930818 [Mycena galopus ATCC 62051]
MASRAATLGHSDDDSDSPSIPTNAKNSFTKPETNHALDLLLGDPATYISGNGFKSKAFTDVSTSLKKKFPDRPVRSKDAIGNRLQYVKGIFEDYEFVRKKSGVGWDDEAKMATAEADFIATFTEAHGNKYAKCFKKPCPFYDHLAQLFGGNKATGTHILHLVKSKKTKLSASAATPTASSTSSSTSAPKRKARQPLENLGNETIHVPSDSDDTVMKPPPSPKPYDDELLLPLPKRPHTLDTIDVADDSDNENNTERPKQKTKATTCDRDRSTSAGSSAGSRRASRNAEMGNEIARGLKKIGEGMSAPIIAKSDTSHVDAIINAFVADPTLLPADPTGNYSTCFLDALGANQMRACSFIKTQNCVQGIALLKLLLVEKEMDVPVDWV